jgi:HD-GYP domain-containing protein (c-di-GMP phosphodiesterase class II)
VVKRLLSWIQESDPRRVVCVMCLCVAALGALGVTLAVLGARMAGIVLDSVIVSSSGVLALITHWAVRHLDRRSQTLRRAAALAEQHYLNVLRQIVRIVEARDRYTHGHSERVGLLAERIAQQLNLSSQRCQLLGLAGQLHDIGLLAVPGNVLDKQGAFNSGEYKTVQKHSEISYDLLQPMESLAEVLPAIRHHHERINGTGYPDGLAGEDISLEARILAVADSYEAMTHDRPHRPAMSPLQATEELRRCSPWGYDPRCVEALAQIIHLGQLKEIMSLVESAPVEATA